MYYGQALLDALQLTCEIFGSTLNFCITNEEQFLTLTSVGETIGMAEYREFSAEQRVVGRAA